MYNNDEKEKGSRVVVISELSEADLKEYIDSTFAKDPEYERFKQESRTAKELERILKNVERRSSKAMEGLSAIEDHVKKKEYDIAFRLCKKAALDYDRLSRAIGDLPEHFGGSWEKGQKSRIKEQSPGSVTFEYLPDGILHIILPELLPKRLKYNASTMEYENTHERSRFKRRYQEAFYREYQNGRFRMHTDKVFLFILNVFSKGERRTDHDNLDGKALQDMVSNMILLDDSPRQCANIYDEREGEYTHTEAYVVPEKDLLPFLQEFYKAG